MYSLKMPRTRTAERNMTFWEVSQFRTFISHVNDPTWRTFFAFQYYTGCRIGETLALQEKDYTGGAVRIDKSLSKQTLTDAYYEIKSTKTGKRRTVPIPSRLKKLLDDYILWKRERGIPSDFLFCGKDGGHLPHSTIRRRFDIYTGEAGPPPHQDPRPQTLLCLPAHTQRREPRRHSLPHRRLLRAGDQHLRTYVRERQDQRRPPPRLRLIVAAILT